MRNIVQYPVQQDEVVAILVQMQQQVVAQEMYFGLHGYVLNKLEQYLQSHPELIEEIFRDK